MTPAVTEVTAVTAQAAAILARWAEVIVVTVAAVVRWVVYNTILYG